MLLVELVLIKIIFVLTDYPLDYNTVEDKSSKNLLGSATSEYLGFSIYIIKVCFSCSSSHRLFVAM